MMPSAAAEVIRQEADLLVSGLRLQASLQDQGLDLLHAEMRALADLLPGLPLGVRTAAETEADFDNMPV